MRGRAGLLGHLPVSLLMPRTERALSALGMLIALAQESYVAIPARIAIRLQGQCNTQSSRRHEATVDETDTATIIQAFQ